MTRGENTAGYARRADHLSVYLPQGELIAVIEIVSPGNKDNTNGLKTFVRKAGKLLRRGVHLLVVDLFPPSVRDPHGIHKAIWDQFKEEPFELPPDKPLTLAAYAAGLGESRLRRKRGGRGPAPGHADFPHARSLRPVPAGSVVPGDLGRVPRGAQGAARTSPEMNLRPPERDSSDVTTA